MRTDAIAIGLTVLLTLVCGATLPADEAAGPTVRVDTVEDLLHAIENAQPHATILVADGHYHLPRYTAIAADHVTLRSESGDREAVILDGAESRHDELIGITSASHVTIADLTVQNVVANAIKINNNTGVDHVAIRNCVIRNVWQRGVKSVRAPELKTRNGLIEHCLFINDRPKSFADDPRDTSDTFGGNYVGAIDLMDAVRWTIRDNVFQNIQGRTRTGRGAIFIWFESRDCVIERNVIIDCDQGVALGNAHIIDGTPYHVAGFTVRNNFITRAPMNPVFIAHSRETAVVHNTIHDPGNERRRSIRVFASNDGLRVAANLINGHPIREEQTEGNVTISDNTIATDLAGRFVDPAAGDLRLKAGSVDGIRRVRRSRDAPEDIAGSGRTRTTLPGAHQPD